MFQYRLGLEGGFEMHWSRIVDAPLLLMLGFLSIFLSQSSAEYWLLILWPLLWFWVTAIAFWRLAGNLAGPIAALYASVVGASVLLGHHIFRPGSVDHHNIQMTATQAAIRTRCGIVSTPIPRLAANKMPATPELT